jgi:hypothetical protein
MRIIASLFGFLAHRIQGRGTNIRARDAGTPSYRHPDMVKCAGASEPSVSCQHEGFPGRLFTQHSSPRT